MRVRFVVSVGVAAAIGLSAGRAEAATLVVAATGVGGAVQVSSLAPMSGPSCGADACSYAVPDGARVTLTPVITRNGSSLAKWLGACGGVPVDAISKACTIPVNGRITTIARFTPVQLFARATDGGHVDASPPGVSCGGGCRLYPYGQAVTISAGAFPGNAFNRWFGPCDRVAGPLCAVTLFRSADIQAIFECTDDVCSISQPLSRAVRVTLSVGKKVNWSARPGSGGPPSGTCPKVCTFSAIRGTMVSVTLSQATARGSWGGACGGIGHACTFQASGGPNNNGPGTSVSVR